MAKYTRGSVGHAMYVAESVYGTIPTGAMSWAGETQEYSPEHNFHQEFVPGPASRSFTEGLSMDTWEMAFRLQALAKVSNWKSYWARFGMGSTSGTADALDSFVQQVDIYDGSTHSYHVANGCKMNRLEIDAKAPGAAYLFNAQNFCQWEEGFSTRAVNTIQNVSLGAEASDPATAILGWNGNSQINVAGGGLATWYPQNFKLIVDNHLTREKGVVTGYDTNKYPTAIGLSPGQREIIFEGQVISGDMTYYNIMKSNTLITSLTIPIDTDTVTLTYGRPYRDQWPKWLNTNDVNLEPVRFRFKSISIA